MTENHQRLYRNVFLKRIGIYWQLIKSLQTGLLLLTGVAGFISARCPLTTWRTLLALAGTLLLTISGSTVLNMVLDKEIDARMARTSNRPLPMEKIGQTEALLFGLFVSILGIVLAMLLLPLYGALITAGLFFDVVIYTWWLKQRTPWSIVWGGIAGGMPVLAGRVLGTGQIDLIGLLLAASVLLWIPTHILTFGLKHASDYGQARVPVFANTHGAVKTRQMISLSTTLAVLIMAACAWLIDLAAGCMYASIGLGIVLLGATTASVLIPSTRTNHGLYKLASVYMLGSMVLIIIGI
ncbi:MAG: protoheme IX farnesyltransferase [Anaerolineales bacterium]|nr:protoheme IX farnesyltransferase [Anaerolineales bacterium]